MCRSIADRVRPGRGCQPFIRRAGAALAHSDSKNMASDPPVALDEGSSNSVLMATEPPVTLDGESLDADTADSQPVCQFLPLCCYRPQMLLAVFCLAVFCQSAIASGLISAVLSTIAQRYGTSNLQTSFLPSTQDIVCILVMSFISFHGGRGNRQRWIAAALTFMGSGAILFGLVQFMGGPFLYSGNLGGVDPTCSASSPSSATSTNCVHSLTLYPVLIAGQALVALGGATIYNLVPPALADCVPAHSVTLYVGIFFVFAALGPAFGFLIAGEFLTSWVDPGRDAPSGLKVTGMHKEYRTDSFSPSSSFFFCCFGLQCFVLLALMLAYFLWLLF